MDGITLQVYNPEKTLPGKKNALLRSCCSATPWSGFFQESYDWVAFKEKCDSVLELVVEFAVSGRKWVA